MLSMSAPQPHADAVPAQGPVTGLLTWAAWTDVRGVVGTVPTAQPPCLPAFSRLAAALPHCCAQPLFYNLYSPCHLSTWGCLLPRAGRALHMSTGLRSHLPTAVGFPRAPDRVRASLTVGTVMVLEGPRSVQRSTHPECRAVGPARFW